MTELNDQRLYGLLSDTLRETLNHSDRGCEVCQKNIVGLLSKDAVGESMGREIIRHAVEGKCEACKILSRLLVEIALQ